MPGSRLGLSLRSDESHRLPNVCHDERVLEGADELINVFIGRVFGHRMTDSISGQCLHKSIGGDVGQL